MNSNPCPSCGTPLSAAQLRKGCPTCLFGLAFDPDRTAAGAGPVPDSVGPYRILRQIGEGGMGAVYLAEQDVPIRRQVALKLIRPGMGGPEVVKRFEAERQALALMDHPSIARVLDAGTTIDGLPYFVMEYFDGEPITDFCDRERLLTEERLRLLADVCVAVQHAHHKGVIHRDIKPSNVLVARDSDERPRIKVIDFGVARAVEPDAEDATKLTQFGMMVGTPAYMSPEQADFQRDRVDTRTDVYGLGVLLYELLTGALPFDPDQLRAHGFEKMCRRIREEDPPVPSARLSDGNRFATDSAARRGVELGSLRREIRGELDWIAMRALEKDPGRRYGSPAGLADDLQRYLRDEPVQAGPPSGLYRLRKFTRRHRFLVGSAAAVLAALLLGAIVSINFAIGQSRALQESERQRSIATAVNEFMVKDVLGRANPTTGSLPDMTLREAIGEAAAAVGDRFADKPLVQASIRASLGKVYYELGDMAAAVEHSRVAAELNAEHLGETSMPAVAARFVLGTSLIRDTRYDEADAVLQKNLDVIDEIAESDPLQHAQVYMALGTLRRRQGRYPESEQAYARCVALLEVSKIDPKVLAMARENYGLALYSQDKFEPAIQALQESVTDFESISGPDSVDVAFVLTNLGNVLMNGRDHPDGWAAGREALERAHRIRVKRLGPNHMETLRSLSSIAFVLEKEGNLAESERVHREVLAARESSLPPGHFDVLDNRYYVAKLARIRGAHAEAESILRDVVENSRESMGPGHNQTQRFFGGLADVLRERGDTAALKQAYLDHFAAIQREIDDGDAPYVTYLGLGWALLNCELEDLRDPPRILALAEDALEAEGGETVNVYDLLAHAHAANHDPAAAMEAARLAIEQLPPTARADHRDYFEDLIAGWESALSDDLK